MLDTFYIHATWESGISQTAQCIVQVRVFDLVITASWLFVW